MEKKLFFTLVLVLLITSSAAADVIYTFSGTPFGLDEPQTFTYTAPDFISGVTTVPAGDLDSCAGTVTCLSITFDPDAPNAGLLAPADELRFETSNFIANFYFPDGAFIAAGEYDNLDSTGNTGHLSVQVVPVPEPATVLLVGVGAAGLLRLRRRKRLE